MSQAFFHPNNASVFSHAVRRKKIALATGLYGNRPLSSDAVVGTMDPDCCSQDAGCCPGVLAFNARPVFNSHGYLLHGSAGNDFFRNFSAYK